MKATNKQFCVPVEMIIFLNWLESQIRLINSQPQTYKGSPLHLDWIYNPLLNSEELEHIRIDGLYDRVADSGQLVVERIENLCTFDVYDKHTKPGR